MVGNPSKFMGDSTNIVAPEHITYDQLYRKMGELFSRGTYFRIPSSILRVALG
jgi:NAD dependent epimerase/dehydratase family enzyme